MHRYAKHRAAPALSTVLAALLFLAGCNSTPLSAPAGLAGSTGDSATAQRQGAPMAQSTVAAVTVPPSAPSDMLGQAELNRARSVFFGFDEFVVAPEQGTLVERHGRYLVAHPALAVRIEGHTDERGGTEYNLALGQKRAEAVRRALLIQGVPAARLEAISWGEGKPRAQGSAEEAWAQNRRADLAYPVQAGSANAAARRE